MTKFIDSKDIFVIKQESTHNVEFKNLSFFHSVAFCNRIKDRNVKFYNLYENEKPIISMAFEEFKNQAISLAKSPYGGLIFDEMPACETLHWYIESVTKQLSHHSQITIIQPHLLNDSNSLLINKALISNGFGILYTEINQHIKVSSSSSFDKIINRNRRRKLTDCKNQGFIFSELNTNQLSDAYPLIMECREEKGYPVTMTLDELLFTFNQFPDHYKLFGVWNKDELIATAVSIIVSGDVMYNFYHGDLLSYRMYSPVTMLVDGIFQYSQKQNIGVLDLGISSYHGKLNDGLFAFKKSLGAIECPKTTYQRNL